MVIIITYDVCTIDDGGKRRLRKVAKVCQNYGQRVQNSVFEANIDYGNFLLLENKLLKIINIERDNIRFYFLGNNWKRRVESYGCQKTYDSEGLIII